MPRTLPMLLNTQPICCPTLEESPGLSEADAVALAIRLKALADPARLRVVSLLLDRLGRGASTRELAPLLCLTEPTVSHHLRTLLASGLVAKERQGTTVYYRVVPEAIQAIVGVLHLSCC
jgi:DNA-binding transcriptional ArsR family regulator